MLINHANADHVHVLIDLPKSQSIENVAKLLKGSSSHWINENNLVADKFSWGRGYGAFSVSQSVLRKVADYIARQEEHHRKRNFAQECEGLVRAYGLTWHDDENR
jgi:REP element-mobilizing transposase RayT